MNEFLARREREFSKESECVTAISIKRHFEIENKMKKKKQPKVPDPVKFYTKAAKLKVSFI